MAGRAHTGFDAGKIRDHFPDAVSDKENHRCDQEDQSQSQSRPKHNIVLLWHVAYAEQIYTDTLWPDYSNEEFYSNIESFQHRQRRFGAEKPADRKGK